jgi:hypothetical protein
LNKKQISQPFEVAGCLKRVPRPKPPASGPERTWPKDVRKEWTDAKRAYSERLSKAFSHALEQSFRSHFPETQSGEGLGTNAASVQGIKSVDVAFNIEGLFLGLGVSVKTIGLPEEKGGYAHNFKRITEEWTTETVLYHRYMPVSIIVGIFFMPWDSMADRSTVTSLSYAVAKFRGFQGRQSIREDFELMERIYVALFKPDGMARFLDVGEGQLGPREVPSDNRLQTFEQVKDDLVRLFRLRNPKLRVRGMPDLDSAGRVTAPIPELDEAFRVD